MFEIRGKHNVAKIFSDSFDESAVRQIIEICNQEFVKGCKIRIMPDYHAGVGCVIGFTADLGNMVVPNLVGVDIGCGMYVVNLGKANVDLAQLDDIIHNCIPSGNNVHDTAVAQFPELKNLHCYKKLKDVERIIRSIGSLGGGNHFIELDIGKDESIYLVVHSGSRNLGKQVADIYQDMAIELCSNKEDFLAQREYIIETYKKQGKKHLIQQALEELKSKYEPQLKCSRDLCYLTGESRLAYLHDMEICQRFATLNRETICDIILQELGLSAIDRFHTVHNYIDFRDNVVRKGSVSAHVGERLIIPLNMRDGSILAVGKGNPDWNCSAPHGAGRIMSRAKAKETISLTDYQEAMQGIFTTSVNEFTLDESPMAYKPADEILANIQETVEVIEIVRPIYNYKANS